MLATELQVAKGRGGRPKKAEGDRGTKHVRVFEDLADMLGWVHYFKNKNGESISVAQILDPIIRGDLIELYAPYEDAVKAIKQAENSAGPPPPEKVKRPKKE